MTDFRIRENMCWCRLKTSHFRISEDMKQTVMDLEHFIREMMIQAMHQLEYLLMHGCHCRKYTGERSQNHDYRICKIRELGKEPEESNF